MRGVDGVKVSLAQSSHRVSAFQIFQPELPVTPRPSLSRPERNVCPGELRRLKSNVGITLLTDGLGLNGDVFPCSVMQNLFTFGFL